MNLMRIIRHLVTGQSAVKRAFPPDTLNTIKQAIARSETTHSGEIVFAVEAALDISLLLKNHFSRERAIDVFSLLRVWDTEQNNGVMIYLLMADHSVEIIADRGIYTRMEQAEWDAACHTMETAFSQGQFEQGILTGIDVITKVLQQYFPADSAGKRKSELSDYPVVL